MFLPPTKVTDALGHSVTTSYNGQNGRVTGSVLEDNAVKLAYTYGEDGRLSELKRTVGSAVQSYAMTYNPFGKLKTLHVGERLLLTNTYNSHNGPLKKTVYANGYTQFYSYDGLERLEKVYYNVDGDEDQAVTYGYAGEGRLKSRTDTPADRVQTYTYDGLGRLLTLKEDTIGGQALVDATYSYDLANRLTQLKYKVGRLWNGNLTGYRYYQYTYRSSDGALTALRVPSGRFAYSYDALKRLTSRAQNTVDGAEVSTSTYSYAPGSGSNATSTLVSGLSVKHGTTTVYTAGYTYDAVGNITGITGTAPRSYEYDAQGQLTKETRGGVAYSYTYDAAGNIKTKTRVDNSGTDTFTYGNSDWRDLLTKFNGHTITYDQSGNPLTWHDGTVFAWTNGRRLASAVNSTTGLNAAYTYDTDGLRLSKTVGGVQHKYVWFGGKLRSESYPDSGSTVKLEFGYDESGRPATFNYNDTWYYYVTNLQGDVVRILAADGTVMAKYAYNAWGELTVCSGTLANVNPLRYRGYYYDVETGRYYLGGRYYDPEICRFINADDTSNLGVNSDFASVNLFAYCGNNPVSRSDSNGDFWEAIAIGFAVGFIGQYVNDVIGNIGSGKTGFDIFTSSSSMKDYLASGLGGAIAAIPGLGLFGTMAVGAAGNVVADSIKGNINNLDSLGQSAMDGAIANGLGWGVAKSVAALKVGKIGNMSRSERKIFLRDKLYHNSQAYANQNLKTFAKNSLSENISLVERNLFLLRSGIYSTVTSTIALLKQ